MNKIEARRNGNVTNLSPLHKFLVEFGCQSTKLINRATILKLLSVFDTLCKFRSTFIRPKRLRGNGQYKDGRNRKHTLYDIFRLRRFQKPGAKHSLGLVPRSFWIFYNRSKLAFNLT